MLCSIVHVGVYAVQAKQHFSGTCRDLKSLELGETHFSKLDTVRNCFNLQRHSEVLNVFICVMCSGWVDGWFVRNDRRSQAGWDELDNKHSKVD